MTLLQTVKLRENQKDASTCFSGDNYRRVHH